MTMAAPVRAVIISRSVGTHERAISQPIVNHFYCCLCYRLAVWLHYGNRAGRENCRKTAATPATHRRCATYARAHSERWKTFLMQSIRTEALAGNQSE